MKRPHDREDVPSTRPTEPISSKRLARREALKGLGALAVSSSALAAIGCSSEDVPPVAITPPTGGPAAPAAAGSDATARSAAGAPAAGTSGGAAGAPASTTSGSAGSSAAGSAAATMPPAAAAGTSGAAGSPAGAAGMSAPAATAGSAAMSPSTAKTTLDMLQCIATPAMTEGPFFIEEKLDRSDLVTGEKSDAVAKATPLKLVMGIYKVNGKMCEPMPGIQVDIWHADAIGVYSDVAAGTVQDVDTRGQKFLRGYQLTDETGVATFLTIYPGWYMSRTIHIHFKLRMPGGGNTSYDFTSQMFFDEMINAKVLGQGVYADRDGTRTVLNDDDHIYNGQPVGSTRPPANGMAPGKLIMPTLVAMGTGYEATLKIGLMI